MSEDTKFDGVMMSLLQQKGNIDLFFDSVFGFLRRNTDFFANQKKAEEIIVNSCRSNFLKYNQDSKKKQEEEQRKKEEADRKRKAKEEAQRKAKETAQKKAEEAVKAQTAATPAAAPAESAKEEKKEDDNEPAPKGNGGRTEHYIWTQTLENLEMFIFLEAQVTKKNMKVMITHQKLSVVVNGTPLVDGKWKDKVNTEETYWTIENGEVDDYKGRYLHINVEKWKNQTSWWNTPIQGHGEINTQKINPEPSKLSDLDGETRSTVEKMMFDMRQKQQGLPSSDELQKQEKMKEFMKAHPELDFSQCKFN